MVIIPFSGGKRKREIVKRKLQANYTTPESEDSSLTVGGIVRDFGDCCQEVVPVKCG